MRTGGRNDRFTITGVGGKRINLDLIIGIDSMLESVYDARGFASQTISSAGCSLQISFMTSPRMRSSLRKVSLVGQGKRMGQI